MKNRVKSVCAYLGAMAALAGAAVAQDPQDGFYLRAGAGVAFTNTIDQTFTFSPDLAFTGTSSTGQQVAVEAGFLFNAAAGFYYTEGIRTELEYRYQTSAIEQVTPIGAIPAQPAFDPDADLKAHFVFSNFFYDFENTSAITPFIGLGVGGAFVETLSGERDAALAYQGRAGLSFAFADGFSADLEYVFTRTNTLRYGPRAEDFTPAGPFAPAVDSDNLETSSIMASLRKQF